MRYQINGLGLWADRHGAGPAVLLLHGFCGSSQDWESQIAPLVRLGRTVITVDIIGHGRSAAPADSARYTMGRCVADLLALLDLLAPGKGARPAAPPLIDHTPPAPTPAPGPPPGAQPAPSGAQGAGSAAQVDLVGYSMGGRIALSLAVAAPGRVRRLLLESASPGLDDPAERAARVVADEALAARIERGGVPAFVAEWERLPLFASQAQLAPDTLARQRAQRLGQRTRGLAGSLRGIGAGRQPSLWAALPDLRVPTLIITGALDEKFCRTGDQMAALLPDARRATVADAGHNIHLERPKAFSDLMVGFMHG